MSQADGFYTMKGYALNKDDGRTSAVEDYLEMIARLKQKNEFVRVCDLSKMLHVKASSVTKMVQQLCRCGYVQAEKYGDIYLTDKGLDVGNYLLYRHGVIHRFLCTLNQSDDELEQTEKIEHFLDCTTVKNLEVLTERLARKDI